MGIKSGRKKLLDYCVDILITSKDSPYSINFKKRKRVAVIN